MDKLDSSRRSLLKAAGIGVLPFPVVSGRQTGLQVTVRQVNRPGFPEIELFATVRGPGGDPVSGLTASEMTIAEDDVDQIIDEVTRPDDDERAGVSVSLVIDTSGSMEGDRIADAKQAASQFVDQLDFDGSDEAQVIAFDFGAAVVQRWANEAEPLQSAIDGLTADGGTALWDTTIEAVAETEPRVGRSVVIALTDGSDRNSSQTLGQAIDAATGSGVPVYTIGLGSGTRFPFSEQPLRDLAAETGGNYYRAPNSDDLASIYERIQQSITGEYQVVYTTSNTATDGTTRTVDLTVEDGGVTGTGTGSYVAPCAPIPTAAFDVTPSEPAAGEEIQFDASPSDPNGGSLSAYEWDFQNDGTVDTTGQTATVTYDQSGSYDVRLTVQKACGVTDVTVETVEVGDAVPAGERTLMITGNAPTEYTLTVDGTLEADTYGGAFRAEDGDKPTENADGTLTRSDETGPVPDRAGETNYLGDRFLFTGSVTELDVPTGSGPPDVNLYLDEANASRDEILAFEDSSDRTHTLMITGNAPTEYTLAVDGTLEADTYGGDFSAEENDTPTENPDGTLTRTDETGPVPDRASETSYLGDRFIVTGRVTELDLPTGAGSPDVNLYLDEELVSRDDVVADG